ncbi:MAG: tetratricopeptide repeat protein, partial [Candidatus Thermoplasmatota archaeon]
MGCPKCGIKIEPHINVCRNCGENLVKYKINELTKALDKATEEGITHITRASIDMIKEINLRDINEEQYSELTKLMIKLLEKTGILTYVEKKEKIELGEEKKKILNAIEAKMNDAEIVFKKPVGGVEIYLKLGNRALDNELYEKALEYYDKALSIVPNHAFAWCSRGTALGDLGRYDEAIDSFEKALSIAPNYALAWYNKGIAFERLG